MNVAATIDAPAKCELRSVIRFLQAEGHSAAEIHRKVYGENFMSDGSVREWCRKFKEGRTDVHDEGGHGRKSVATVGQRHKRPSEKVQLGSFRPSTV